MGWSLWLGLGLLLLLLFLLLLQLLGQLPLPLLFEPAQGGLFFRGVAVEGRGGVPAKKRRDVEGRIAEAHHVASNAVVDGALP